MMDSISQKAGEIIGDPASIHQEINDVFRKHYAMPLDFDNAQHNAPDWEPYAEDQTLLNDAFQDSNIPPWV